MCGGAGGGRAPRLRAAFGSIADIDGAAVELGAVHVDLVLVCVMRGQRLDVAGAVLEVEVEPAPKLALVAGAADARAAADQAVAASFAALAFAQLFDVSPRQRAFPVRAVVRVRKEPPSSSPDTDNGAALRDRANVVFGKLRLLSRNISG